jgi:uncharacterized protein YggL (DUF469 family)
MTSDEVIKLIENNGLTLHGDIEHFAELVAQHEREACAKLCEKMWHQWLDSPEENEPNKPDAEDCYRAIRARGQT